MKKLIRSLKVVAVICFALLFSLSSVYAADFKTVGHSATVSVPDSLAISADTTDVVLTFSNYVKDSESTSQTVNYTVLSNNMRQADGAAAINVNLDALYDRVDLKAKVGTYTKVTGNTSLAAANADFVTIGTSNLGVALKTGSTGDGKILNGTLPITYKAVATADMPTGNQTHLLFVTLTTI